MCTSSFIIFFATRWRACATQPMFSMPPFLSAKMRSASKKNMCDLFANNMMRMARTLLANIPRIFCTHILCITGSLSWTYATTRRSSVGSSSILFSRRLTIFCAFSAMTCPLWKYTTSRNIGTTSVSGKTRGTCFSDLFGVAAAKYGVPFVYFIVAMCRKMWPVSALSAEYTLLERMTQHYFTDTVLASQESDVCPLTWYNQKMWFHFSLRTVLGLLCFCNSLVLKCMSFAPDVDYRWVRHPTTCCWTERDALM